MKLIRKAARSHRGLHLLENEETEGYTTRYPIDGDNFVKNVRFEAGRVYINSTQYFDLVPELAWNFYIGCYKPAQKWLKDRMFRALEFDDILQYQKIVHALCMQLKQCGK